MYLRTTQRRNKDGSLVRYLALAENARDPVKGYVQAKVIHNFGRADQLDRAALERLVRSIRRVLGDEAGGDEAGGDEAGRALQIEAVFDLGVVHVVRRLWDELGIGAVIREQIAEKKLKAPHEAALFAMVAQRLDRPGSKLACHERWLERVWLPEARSDKGPLRLSQLYRALDLLAEQGAAIEEAVFWRSADLFRLDVDLVFYDATTAWFESEEDEGPGEDWRGLTFAPLRKRGHSKEGRDNDPQVVIALAVTREGLPVRSWVFPGNTPDVTTVAQVKKDLGAMRLGRALFVGDAGMHSKANLTELAKGAGRYILATPVGRLGELGDQILSHRGRYAEVGPHLKAKEVVIGQGERRRRFILCRNDEEGARQRHQRAALLERLAGELESLKGDHRKAACKLVASKRYRRYLSLDDEGRPYIDRDKLVRAEHLDGKFVLTTNDDSLSVADVALGYKGLWIIEACFRRMKTTGLSVRPMFHWTPRRIAAHVRLCVLALMIQRAAELRSGLSWLRLTTVLSRLKAVRHLSESQAIVQTTKIDDELAEILKKLNISKPKPILAVE